MAMKSRNDKTIGRLFSEQFPDMQAGDKVQAYSLLVTEEAKPCRICGNPTHFTEWCTESPLCGLDCYDEHFRKINEVCNGVDREDAIVPDEEIIASWIAGINLNDPETVRREIEEVNSSISNEKLWRDGSATDEQRRMHSQNIVNNREYLKRLTEMLKER